MEYELNSEQCAEVALYMYKCWQEAMQPPLLIYKSFPDWLETIIAQNQSNKVDKEKHE